MTFETRKTNVKNHRVPVIIFLSSFILYAFIAFCAPFTSDDFEFSGYSFSFAELLEYVLYYGNGRFLGNMITLLIINNRFLQVIMKAAMMSSIIVLIPSILGTTSTIAYLCSFLMFIGMSPRIFAQTFTWTSGFTNFTPPIFLSLIILHLFQKTRSQERKHHALILPVVFLLGISSQLFSEHTTITNICLALFVLIYTIRQKTDHIALPVVWLSAVLTGALIMFAIPHIFYVPDNYSEGYRQIHMNNLAECLSTAMQNFSSLFDYLLANRLAIMMAVITAIATVIKYHMFERMKGAVIAFGIFFAVYCFIIDGFWVGESEYLRKILTIMLPLSLIAGAFWILAAVSRQYRVYISIFLLFLSSTAPLLFVSPIGERCLLLGYTCFVSLTLFGIHNLQSRISERNCMFVKKTVISVICTIAVALCCLFTHVNHVTVTLYDHIEQEMEKDRGTIYIFSTPYNYTFGCLDKHFERLYYNHEWGDVDFIMLSMDEWMTKYGTND